MNQKIKWELGESGYKTKKFGGFMTDEVQGVIHYYSDENKWSGALINWDNEQLSKFRYDFNSKRAATRWTNQQLRKSGIQVS